LAHRFTAPVLVAPAAPAAVSLPACLVSDLEAMLAVLFVVLFVVAFASFYGGFIAFGLRWFSVPLSACSRC
jgi:hypothetical protein